MTDTPPPVAMFAPLMPEARARIASAATLMLPDALAALDPATGARVRVAVSSAMTGAPDDLLAALPNLAHILSAGAGRDRYDLADLARRGIAFEDTGDLVTSDTAEMAVTLVLALGRDLLRADRHVRGGAWAAEGPFPTRPRLVGARAGILGLGRIGRLTGERLAALGLEVGYCTRTPRDDAPWPWFPDARALAAWADHLVVTLPGGDGTHHIVDAEVLAALGPQGRLVNVARGSVVDTGALIEALAAGTIAGAALDVFEGEPAPDPRLTAFDSVILTPHAAALTTSYAADLGDRLAARIRVLNAP